MKRFLIFAGDLHYPTGGWYDFEGDFDTLEDAKTALLNINCDWWHIVDTVRKGGGRNQIIAYGMRE